MPQEQVCYTFEAAVEMAVEMEEKGFRHYLAALRKLQDRTARLIIRDAALDELEHKHQLEKALVDGEIAGHLLDHPVPTMNLAYALKKSDIDPNADGRQALAYAIHLEKESLEFYRRMTQGCSGAPMASLFERIYNDETKHLQALEDLYEKHFLPEN
ncbi:MAG: ferritin family protein [Desulfuromonadales bacterium]|jgi:rubrerythrin